MGPAGRQTSSQTVAVAAGHRIQTKSFVFTKGGEQAAKKKLLTVHHKKHKTAKESLWHTFL